MSSLRFAIAIPPLLVVYFFIQRYYIPTARELQRIESITRSPIYSKFGEALNGVPTIRAYRKEQHYTLVSTRRGRGTGRWDVWEVWEACFTMGRTARSSTTNWCTCGGGGKKVWEACTSW